MSKSSQNLHRIFIYFDKKESNAFGGLSNQSIVLDVTEEQASKVITQFHEGAGVFSVNLGKDERGVETWKYINAKNILFIDELVIPNNPKEIK